MEIDCANYREFLVNNIDLVDIDIKFRILLDSFYKSN